MQATRECVLLTSEFVRHPLRCRKGSSDRDVFRQIFVQREYACLDDLTDVDLVLDCGANVGYSSAYLLDRFPECHVVAVEPDPDNFALLEANLTPYRGRVRTVRSAVWSHPTGLVLSNARYRDGREWARQVRECRPGEPPAFTATDIGSLLRESGREKISILKMDIEGAEAVVFASDCASWLGKVDALVVELHDDSSFGGCSEVFFAAIVGEDFDVSRNGELTVCRRRRRSAQAVV
jgi:FkbM family methyltransferase